MQPKKQSLKQTSKQQHRHHLRQPHQQQLLHHHLQLLNLVEDICPKLGGATQIDKDVAPTQNLASAVHGARKETTHRILMIGRSSMLDVLFACSVQATVLRPD